MTLLHSDRIHLMYVIVAKYGQICTIYKLVHKQVFYVQTNLQMLEHLYTMHAFGDLAVLVFYISKEFYDYLLITMNTLRFYNYKKYVIYMHAVTLRYMH